MAREWRWFPGTGLRSARCRAVAAAAGAAALLAACSGSGDPAAGGPGASAGNTAGFPVTVTDCGRTLRFDAPPRRVVILSPVIARDLVALGLGDRIVGQSGTDYLAPPPQTAAVPVLSHTNATSTEVLLGAQPDLVISDLVYRLTPGQGGASRDRLEQAGIPSYVASAGCTTAATEGRVADEFTDLANLGRIFGVPERAAALAARLNAQLADIRKRVGGQPPVSVFEGTRYGGQFYPVAGLGLDALTVAGGRSIFPHVAQANASVSKEEIVARDPQVIVDGVYGTVDRGQVVADLTATFPTVAAVRDNRMYVVGYVASEEPGSALATMDALRQVAMALHPAAFRR